MVPETDASEARGERACSPGHRKQPACGDSAKRELRIPYTDLPPSITSWAPRHWTKREVRSREPIGVASPGSPGQRAAWKSTGEGPETEAESHTLTGWPWVLGGNLTPGYISPGTYRTRRAVRKGSDLLPQQA